MTTTDVTQMGNELINKEWFVNVDGRDLNFNLKDYNWNFKFNNRKRALGLCSYGKKEISISKPMFENNNTDISTWRNTILHEIAHAIDYEFRGTSDHGRIWKTIAIQIGCNGQRTTSLKNKVQGKYTATCPNCGMTTPKHRYPKRAIACKKCCDEHNNGKFSNDFAYIITQNY